MNKKKPQVYVFREHKERKRERERERERESMKGKEIYKHESYRLKLEIALGG